MKISGIYVIKNLINNKKYIGQSNNVYDRWSKHKSELNNNCHHNDYLQNAWNKYGSDNFYFYVLEFCNIDCLDEREVYYIDFYETMNRNKGYNLISGGGRNKQYSAETCKKISDALCGHEVSPDVRLKISKNHADVGGKNNPNYGKHLSDDAKRKISEANKGRVSSKRNKTPVYCVELNKRFIDASEASKALNVDSSCILKCCRNERKTCGGYQWKFIILENNIC